MLKELELKKAKLTVSRTLTTIQQLEVDVLERLADVERIKLHIGQQGLS